MYSAVPGVTEALGKDLPPTRIRQRERASQPDGNNEICKNGEKAEIGDDRPEYCHSIAREAAIVNGNWSNRANHATQCNDCQ